MRGLRPAPGESPGSFPKPSLNPPIRLHSQPEILEGTAGPSDGG
nr:MAG TPA: hypothetical protein [Caudoviricetes sp.]